MDFANPTARTDFAKANGFDVQTRSQDWAPLRQDLRVMVMDRLRKLPWVPSSVIANVLTIPESQHGGMLLPIPIATTTPAGNPSPLRPAWLDTNEKRMVWDEIASRFKQAEMAFNANQVAQGRLIMERAYADTRFWDRAIAVAQFLSTPVRVVEQAATGFLGSNVFKVGLIIAVVYGAFVVSKRQKNKGSRA